MVPLEVDSLADSGVYTIEFNVEIENEFSDLVSEEKDKHKITTKLIFNIYSGGSLIDPQTLDYADFYIWSDLNDREDWLKCEVEDGYYVLYLNNVESKQYEWSGVLYYNNEEIPDGTDTDIWNYKVNSGGTIDGTWSEDNVFTMDESYFEDNTNIITIGFDIHSGYTSLSGILPESGYVISRAGQSFTLSLDLTYGGSAVTCPEFGNFYIIGGWHVTDGSWDEWDLLTYNESTGRYETTFATDDVIYATTYSYDIVFIHNNQSFDYWTHKLTSTDRTMTLSWTDSETLSHTDSCSLDVDVSQFHALAMDSSGLTVYFNITSSGNDYQTTYGNDLYAAGSWGDGSWGFYECTYDDTHSAGSVLFYRVVLPITSAGQYEFKIISYTSGSTPSWPNGSGSSNGYIVEGVSGANATMTISSTDITYGYSLQYFYLDGGSGNYQ